MGKIKVLPRSAEKMAIDPSTDPRFNEDGTIKPEFADEVIKEMQMNVTNPIQGGSLGTPSETYGTLYEDLMSPLSGSELGPDDEGYADYQTTVDATKLGIQGNLVQSGIDAQLAIAMANNQAALSSQLMENTANLELRNTTEIMAQEQQYGLAQMASEATLADQLASNQFDRNELGKASDQINTQANMALQSSLNINEAVETLKLSGLNDIKLQELQNEGALEQLVQVGVNEQDLQKLVNSGAMDQINANNAAAYAQLELNTTTQKELQILVLQ